MRVDSAPADDGATTQPVAEAGTSEQIAETPFFSNVPWMVRPSPGINYHFVSMMYLGGSAIALLFYLLEKQMLAPLLEDEREDEGDSASKFNEIISSSGDSGATDEGEPWKEFAKGMEGMYLIFVPFVPCLLWSFIVRYYWMNETKVSQKKKDN